jgi:hypothetical protein
MIPPLLICRAQHRRQAIAAARTERQRGWHVNDRGIYTRRAEAEPQALPEHELEAGS